MALCYNCHIYVGSNPKDHVKLWEKRFTQTEKNIVDALHRDFTLKKKNIATESRLKALKEMLADAKRPN